MDEADAEVWEAMRKERDAGRTRLLGVSNVSLEHLEQMKAATTNCLHSCRIAASRALGWDREVRAFLPASTKSSIRDSRCSPRIREVLRHPPMIALAGQLNATVRPKSYSLCARSRNAAAHGHVQRRAHEAGLGQPEIELPPEIVQAIESIAG